MRYALRVFAAAFVLLAGTFPCAAQSAKGQYKGIVVTVFDAQKGIDFPPDFQEALFKGLVAELGKLKKFSSVLKQGDPGAEGAAGSLKLAGTVIGVDEGSRAARVLVGFGAGKSWIKAHVTFADAASGEVKFEKDVQATFSGGWSFSGGDASKVADNLAKEIAKVAKSQFF